MYQTAKIFANGRSQAVRLPAEFRFDCPEVFIRRDPVSGDVILSPKLQDWDALFARLDAFDIPDDFLHDREQPPLQERDIF